MVKATTLQGTPSQLGEQIAMQVLSQPLRFAFEQLDDKEYGVFCAALLSATAAMIARQIGTDRVAMMTEALYLVTNAVPPEQKETLQ